MAVLPEDYVAIRILEPSDPRPDPDPDGCTDFDGEVFNKTCVAVGPAYPAGISDDGDVFGHMETNHPHENHSEQGIRWLRRDSYKGDFLGSPELELKHWNFCALGPRARGLHGAWVSPDGIATGRAIPGAYHLDIVSGEFTIVGNGELEKASGNLVMSQVVDGADDCSTEPQGYTVSDVTLIDPPFTQDNRGVVHEIDRAARALAINDRHVIVGSTDPTCFEASGLLLCSGQSVAMKIESTGSNAWGEVVEMEQLNDSFNESRAIDLSNTDPAFAVGYARGQDNLEHGVLWNVNTGQIIVDFGVGGVPHRISSSGNYAVGARRPSFFDPREPGLWWTEDDWETWQFLPIQEIMDAVPGGEHWAEISVLTRTPHPNARPWWLSSPIAVNKHGQLLLVGKLSPEAPIESLTEWPRSFATGEDCIDPDDFVCGIPFILDTLELGGVVIKGDVSNDSIVDFLDITPFINAQSAEGDEDAFLLLTPNGCFLCADIDMDGAVDFLDITPFVNLLDEVAAAVPEPGSAALLLLGLASLLRGRGNYR